MEPANLFLSAYQEQGNWARHFDTMRLAVVSLVFTVATGGVTAVLKFSISKRQLLAGLALIAIFGTGLTVLSSLYTVLYETADARSGQMLRTASKYVEHPKTSFRGTKVVEKLDEARLEKFGLLNGTKITVWHWVKQMWVEGWNSTWVIMSAVFGILLPICVAAISPFLLNQTSGIGGEQL